MAVVYRLTKIYTRKGDAGKTRLGDGSLVSKDDSRIEAYGNVDELNSLVGLLLTYRLSKTMQDALQDVQHDLFDLGGELSIPGHSLLNGKRVADLERLIDDLNDQLEPLKEFILPGGTPAAAICHLARTVCRRAERSLVTLTRTQEVTSVSLPYLNRLSDLFFVLARTINKESGYRDILWRRDRA